MPILSLRCIVTDSRYRRLLHFWFTGRCTLYASPRQKLIHMALRIASSFTAYINVGLLGQKLRYLMTVSSSQQKQSLNLHSTGERLSTCFGVSSCANDWYGDQGVLACLRLCEFCYWPYIYRARCITERTILGFACRTFWNDQIRLPSLMMSLEQSPQ